MSQQALSFLVSKVFSGLPVAQSCDFPTPEHPLPIVLHNTITRRWSVTTLHLAASHCFSICEEGRRERTNKSEMELL